MEAWQVITGADGQSGSGGRIKALEFLNDDKVPKVPIVTFVDMFVDYIAPSYKISWPRWMYWEKEILNGFSAPGDCNKDYKEWLKDKHPLIYLGKYDPLYK